MAKKRFGESNVFSGEAADAAVDTSFEAADALLYGEIAKIDEGRQIAKPINIFDIQPDFAQPRRAMPSAVREQWDGSPRSLSALLGVWLDMAQVEKGAPLDIGRWLEGGGEEDEDDENASGDETPGPLEASLMTIVELAASIKRDGLTNPITVVSEGPRFRLETGERRWLAYHLLYASARDTAWSKIPARVVEHFNVWRQATENTARADLNAIGKARQFAILMMDLWQREENGLVQFRPLSDFPSERAYYAQVIDLRPPYGKSGLLLGALGAKTRTAFARRRLLLGLPDEAWKLADDYSVSEDSLIECAKLPPDAAVAALRALIDNVPSRNIAKTAHEKSAAAAETNELVSPHNRRVFGKVWKLANKVSAGQTRFSDKELAAIAHLRAWLDEVENSIRERQKSGRRL
ncbi:MAG: ParB N-terminal domain-containing protein [Chloroflexi bacterium]|nr:ParB N-terminal domain-containing protein [Chloroflexota bacterium]